MSSQPHLPRRELHIKVNPSISAESTHRTHTNMLNLEIPSIEENVEPLRGPLPESSPESEPSRWVRVMELAEGGYAGEFRFVCAGILRPRRKSEQEEAEKMPTRQDHMLRSILAVLKAGDAVEFHFQGGGGYQLQWEIRGRSYRSTPDQANQDAESLRPSFHTLIAAIGEQCRFEPKVPEDAQFEESFLFRDDLAAANTSLALGEASTPMGFQAPTAGPGRKRIVIPVFQPKKGMAFPSLAAVIAGSPVPLSCRVRLIPFTLTRRDSQMIKRAMDCIALEQAKRSSDHLSDADSSLTGCKEALAQWHTSHAGFRVQAELFSAAPLPAALRGLIANELFPNNSAALHGSSGLPSTEPASDLDLTNCIPARGTLPVLFPDLETLQRHEFTQIFNRKAPKLPTGGLRLGQIAESGLRMKVHADSTYRDRHTYIIGATGTGKSTLLLNSLQQDIAAGEGFCLIDPHGDLYEQAFLSIPASRQKDVILLNPCETDAVPGINFLEVTSEKTRAFEVNYAINEFVKMLERIYNMRECGGPMFETYFRNALLLLMDTSLRGHTLVELAPIFEDKEFRDHLKKHCTNRYAVNFWTKQAEKAGGEASLQNIAPYITSKLNLLVQSALLRPIIGQSRSTINFREVMDRRKILLVNLSKGQLGELDMQLLGMIIIGKIFSSAMSRSALRQEHRTPFHLYVDEFQNFTTDTVAALLSEARKFQLCLTLANQNLAQLNNHGGKQNLLDAILGNVGSFVLFRVGAPDAEKMEVYTRPHFNYEDLQNLPNYHALARLQTAEGPSIPFVFRTDPPAVMWENRSVLKTIRRRQRRYRSQREQVEKQILDRQNTAVPPKVTSIPTKRQEPDATGMAKPVGNKPTTDDSKPTVEVLTVNGCPIASKSMTLDETIALLETLEDQPSQSKPADGELKAEHSRLTEVLLQRAEKLPSEKHSPAKNPSRRRKLVIEKIYTSEIPIPGASAVPLPPAT